MSDLHYPSSAGWKVTDTSREAARIITPRAAIQRELVLGAYRRNIDLTPEEAWQAIGGDTSLGAVRSRCSELKGDNLLEATGEKRRGSSGLKAAVLRVVK